jgi:ribonucleoside-diphosphate reductase beta chain
LPTEEPAVDLDAVEDRLPSYLELVRRWEDQQWSVSSLDFGPDRAFWEQSSRSGRRSMLWNGRLFFNGEERVAATLAPFVWAAPTVEMELFLATQLADEAKHTLFFERWWRAVPGSEAPDMAKLIEEVHPMASEGYEELFYQRLPSAADRLARDRTDLGAFIEGITLYHLVVEATLALTGQRFRLEAMRDFGQTDFGFYHGFMYIARDESRHISFGVRVLRDAIREDRARFLPLIRTVVEECLPLVVGTLQPPEGDLSYFTDFGQSQGEVVGFALNLLNKRLRLIGAGPDFALPG